MLKKRTVAACHGIEKLTHGACLRRLEQKFKKGRVPLGPSVLPVPIRDPSEPSPCCASRHRPMNFTRERRQKSQKRVFQQPIKRAFRREMNDCKTNISGIV